MPASVGAMQEQLDLHLQLVWRAHSRAGAALGRLGARSLQTQTQAQTPKRPWKLNTRCANA